MTDEPIIIPAPVLVPIEGEPAVQEAVGIAVDSEDENLGAAMEAAMSQAVLDAYAEGITDPDEIRGRMLAAQEVVVAGWGQAPAED